MVLEYIIIHIPVGDSPQDLVMAGLPCHFIRIRPIGGLVVTDMVTDTDIAGDIITDTITDTGPVMQEADMIPEMCTDRDHQESVQQQEIVFQHNP